MSLRAHHSCEPSFRRCLHDVMMSDQSCHPNQIVASAPHHRPGSGLSLLAYTLAIRLHGAKTSPSGEVCRVPLPCHTWLAKSTPSRHSHRRGHTPLLSLPLSQPAREDARRDDCDTSIPLSPQFACAPVPPRPRQRRDEAASVPHRLCV